MGAACTDIEDDHMMLSEKQLAQKVSHLLRKMDSANSHLYVCRKISVMFIKIHIKYRHQNCKLWTEGRSGRAKRTWVSFATLQ
jgi:hypothetical protein